MSEYHKSVKVQNAILIPETMAEVGEGVSGAKRALVRVDGVPMRAIVKRAEVRVIAVECFCATVCKALRLPTAEPAIVLDPRDDSLLYGSVDLQYPSLTSYLSWRDPPTQLHIDALAEILAQWKQCGQVIVFDELICNPDRNIGNLIFDGVDLVLIDHGLAMRSSEAPANKLAAIVLRLFSTEQIQGVLSAGTSAAIAYSALLNNLSPSWADIRSAFVDAPEPVRMQIAELEFLIGSVLPYLLQRFDATIPPPLFQQVK